VRFLRFSIIWIYALIIFIPLLVVIESSFKSLADLYTNPLLPSRQMNLAAYQTLISQVPLLHYFRNSFIVTVATIVIVLWCSSMIAFGILRLPRILSAIIYGVFSLGMMIPTQVNMIPVFLELSHLHIIDTLYGLIFVESAFLLPVAVFIIGGFMRTLQKELLEAAWIDGANEWQMFFRIAVPLSTPSIASAAIFCSVIVWNDLLFPLLLLKSSSNWTIPLALLSFEGQYQTNYPVIFAGVLLASIPMVVLYVFLQRYFIAGITAGAIKG